MTDPRPWWAGRLTVLIGVAALAFNLRPPALAISPLLNEIRGALGIDGIGAGILTTLPPLCFAAMGLVAPGLAARLGPHRTALLALLAIIAGQVVRVLVPGAGVFFAGTTVALIGLAIGNVILPTLVRLHFPDRIGQVTGLYSLLLGIGVAVASLAAVPVAEATGSWRWSLAVWAVTAAIAAAPWLGLARHDRSGAVRRGSGVGVAAVARTRIGWVIALFFGVQSVHAYAVYGWLPTIYVDAGLTAAQGGLMLGIMTAVGIPLSFWIPRHVAATVHPGRLMAVLVAAGVVGFAGLLVIPTTLPWLWAVLISIEISSFPAYLTLLGLRGGSPEATAALSGFSQAVGYLMAAAGPMAMGVLSTLTGGWAVPLLAMLILCLPLAVLGQLAVRPGSLQEELDARARRV
ncbi:MAG: MFS transporter [Microlunatus sp.]